MEINTEWRPPQTMAVHTGWLNAILAGHARVAAGLAIPAPICVLLSAKTAVPTRWSEELTSADSVLVVDAIARAALKLGPSVTVERIAGRAARRVPVTPRGAGGRLRAARPMGDGVPERSAVGGGMLSSPHRSRTLDG